MSHADQSTDEVLIPIPNTACVLRTDHRGLDCNLSRIELHRGRSKYLGGNLAALREPRRGSVERRRDPDEY